MSTYQERLKERRVLARKLGLNTVKPAPLPVLRAKLSEPRAHEHIWEFNTNTALWHCLGCDASHEHDAITRAEAGTEEHIHEWVLDEVGNRYHCACGCSHSAQDHYIAERGW